jgi:hypothetical protein
MQQPHFGAIQDFTVSARIFSFAWHGLGFNH